MSLIPNETCPESKPGRPWCSIRDDKVVFGYHCSHWYEDDGCCYCGTDEPNLIIIEA